MDFHLQMGLLCVICKEMPPGGSIQPPPLTPFLPPRCFSFIIIIILLHTTSIDTYYLFSESILIVLSSAINEICALSSPFHLAHCYSNPHLSPFYVWLTSTIWGEKKAISIVLALWCKSLKMFMSFILPSHLHVLKYFPLDPLPHTLALFVAIVIFSKSPSS